MEVVGGLKPFKSSKQFLYADVQVVHISISIFHISG